MEKIIFNYMPDKRWRLTLTKSSRQEFLFLFWNPWIKRCRDLGFDGQKYNFKVWKVEVNLKNILPQHNAFEVLKIHQLLFFSGLKTWRILVGRDHNSKDDRGEIETKFNFAQIENNISRHWQLDLWKVCDQVSAISKNMNIWAN